MIMVDEERLFPGANPPFHNGSCHLTTDGPIHELHEFAQRIGLKRAWFQHHRFAPHYDLTPRRRRAALQAGAVFVPGLEQARRRRKPVHECGGCNGDFRCEHCRRLVGYCLGANDDIDREVGPICNDCASPFIRKKKEHENHGRHSSRG